MTAPVGWPDAEAIVMAIHEPIAPAYQTTPEQITIPLIQVIRVGGVDDGVTDRPIVLTLYYGVGDNGYDEAKTMAETGRQAMLAAGGTAVVVDGVSVFIDSVRTVTSPVETPQDNPALRRKAATYRLAYRRPF